LEVEYIDMVRQALLDRLVDICGDSGNSQCKIGPIDGTHMDLVPLDAKELTLPVLNLFESCGRTEIRGVNDFVLE